MSEKFRSSKPSAPWDGVTERRQVVRPPAPDADFPVTHEYLESRLAASRKQTIDHFDGRFDQLESLICDGFPNGDPRSHREVHEGYIKNAADRAALWRAVREKVVSGAVWAALLLIGTALIEHIKTLLHMGAK